MLPVMSDAPSGVNAAASGCEALPNDTDIARAVGYSSTSSRCRRAEPFSRSKPVPWGSVPRCFFLHAVAPL